MPYPVNTDQRILVLSSSRSLLVLQPSSHLTLLTFLLNTINSSLNVSSLPFQHSNSHHLPTGYLSTALFSLLLPTLNGLVTSEYNMAKFAATSDSRTCNLGGILP